MYSKKAFTRFKFEPNEKSLEQVKDNSKEKDNKPDKNVEEAVSLDQIILM